MFRLMLRLPALPRSLAAAALAGALVLTGCSSDDAEPAASSSSKAPAEDAAAEDAAADPEAVSGDVNAAMGVLIDEVVAVIDAGLADDAMDDFAAFVDEWFPETSAWVAWDTFPSETHAYATLRTLIGMSMLAVGLSDDQEAAVAELREGFTTEAEWVSFEDGVAIVSEPGSDPAEDTLPLRLVERDGRWLLEGSTFTDEWFAEQGTTAEEALNS